MLVHDVLVEVFVTNTGITNKMSHWRLVWWNSCPRHMSAADRGTDT